MTHTKPKRLKKKKQKHISKGEIIYNQSPKGSHAKQTNNEEHLKTKIFENREDKYLLLKYLYL